MRGKYSEYVNSVEGGERDIRVGCKETWALECGQIVGRGGLFIADVFDDAVVTDLRGKLGIIVRMNYNRMQIRPGRGRCPHEEGNGLKNIGKLVAPPP